MAISEACQLWIEQRVTEELEGKVESGKSLRAIGREIADEIEKYFEASVKPETIYHKARRIEGGTNVPPKATPQNETEKGGNSGNKITPVRIAQEVKKEMSHASSEREAERRVANKIGRPENSVHVTHQREKAKRKVNQDKFWMSVSVKINRLTDEISKNGRFPISVKQETMNKLSSALLTLKIFLEEVP